MSATGSGMRTIFSLGRKLPFRLRHISRQYNIGKISCNGGSDYTKETSTVLEKFNGIKEDVEVCATHELGYTPKDSVMWMVEYLHSMGGLEYWASIVGVTFVVRFFMLPLAIKTQQNTAAMACVRPEAERIQAAYKRHPNYENDHQMRMQMAEEMKALWKKYDVNPFRALALPAVQLPIFVSFFLAMKDMPQMYPEMSTGGALWFTDLAAADQTMILPVINGLSFLAMVEMGSDGMAANQASTMKTVMRVVAIAMIPATMYFNTGIFVYWGANNLFSLVQTGVMRLAPIRAALGIRKMPTPEATPEIKLANSLRPFKAYGEKFKKLIEVEKDARVEIIDGVLRKAPPPPNSECDRKKEKGNDLSESTPTIFSSARNKSKKIR